MQETAKPGIQRRKHFWVDKKFQLRMIGRFMLVMIGGIFLSHAVTLGFFKLKEMLNPSARDIIYFSNPMTENLAFSQTLEVLWLPLVVSSLVGTVLVLFFALFYSHRMAGPLFNLKRSMRQAESGDWNVPVKIRKQDEFHDVEEALNRLLQAGQARMDKLAQVIAGLPPAQRKKIEAIFRDEKKTE